MTKAFQQTAYPLAPYFMRSLILTRGRLILMLFGVFKYAAYVTGNLGLHFHMMWFVFVNAEEEKNMERDELGLFLGIPRFAYPYMLEETAKNTDQAVSKLIEF
jgi:hypothetical protein